MADNGAYVTGFAGRTVVPSPPFAGSVGSLGSVRRVDRGPLGGELGWRFTRPWSWPEIRGEVVGRRVGRDLARDSGGGSWAGEERASDGVLGSGLEREGLLPLGGDLRGTKAVLKGWRKKRGRSRLVRASCLRGERKIRTRRGLVTF